MADSPTIYAADVSAETLPALLEQPRKELKQASASQVNTFRDCERKWYFGKVLSIREPQSAAARQGERVHKELEELTLGLRTLDQLSPEAAELVQYLPEEQEQAAEGTKMPLVEILRAGHEDFTLVEPHFVLSGGEWPLPVQGFIDRLDIPPRASKQPAVVIDYKTTSNLRYVPLAEEVLASAQKVIYTELAFQQPFVSAVDFTLLYTQKRKHKDAPTDSRKISVLTRREEREDPKHGKAALIADLNRMVQASGLGLYDTKVNTGSCTKYNGCPYAHLCDKGGETEQENGVMSIFKSMVNKQQQINQATQPAPAAPTQGTTNPMLTHNPGTVFQQKGVNPFAKPAAAAPVEQLPVQTAAPAEQPAAPAPAPAAANPFNKFRQAAAPVELAPAPAAPAPEQPAEPEYAVGSVADITKYKSNAELRAADNLDPPPVNVPKDGKPINREQTGGRRTDAELYRDRMLCLITGPDNIIRWGALTPDQVSYFYAVQEWYPIVGLKLPEDEKYFGLVNPAPAYVVQINAGKQHLLSDKGKEKAGGATTGTVAAVTADPQPAAVQHAQYNMTMHPEPQPPAVATKDASNEHTWFEVNGFTLYVGCIPYQSPFVMLQEFLNPVFEDIEQTHKLPYWNLQEFGKGKQELAAKCKKLVEHLMTTGDMPNICVPAIDSSMEECVSVLRALAGEVVQRC